MACGYTDAHIISELRNHSLYTGDSSCINKSVHHSLSYMIIHHPSPSYVLVQHLLIYFLTFVWHNIRLKILQLYNFWCIVSTKHMYKPKTTINIMRNVLSHEDDNDTFLYVCLCIYIYLSSSYSGYALARRCSKTSSPMLWASFCSLQMEDGLRFSRLPAFWNLASNSSNAMAADKLSRA